MHIGVGLGGLYFESILRKKSLRFLMCKDLLIHI